MSLHQGGRATIYFLPVELEQSLLVPTFLSLQLAGLRLVLSVLTQGLRERDWLRKSLQEQREESAQLSSISHVKHEHFSACFTGHCLHVPPQTCSVCGSLDFEA